jgi:hypothetical protein
MYNKTYIKNWHNEIKISNWKTSPNQKSIYIQHRVLKYVGIKQNKRKEKKREREI